jgi:membrane associated rhomboid family serine protease
MERLLSRLERKLGRFAIPNLPQILVAGMAVVFVLGALRPDYAELLWLDMNAVRQGQVWRLVTFAFLPSSSSLWFIFALFFFWTLGKSLEDEWGSFRLNVYYLLGLVGTVLASLVTGWPMGNTYLNLSLLLAFATIFPDYEVRLFLILPVKAKWLGILTGGY